MVFALNQRYTRPHAPRNTNNARDELPGVKCPWGEEPLTGATSECGVHGLCLDEQLELLAAGRLYVCCNEQSMLLEDEFPCFDVWFLCPIII